MTPTTLRAAKLDSEDFAAARATVAIQAFSDVVGTFDNLQTATIISGIPA